MKRRKLTIAVLTAAVLAGGGTATAFAVSHGSGDDDGNGGTVKVTVTDAIDSALRAVPGTVTSAGLDDSAWEIDVHGKDGVWHDVTLDATTGKVREDERSDSDDRAPSPTDAPVSASVAARAATKAVPGTVTSIDLDHRHSADGLVWEADVRGKDGRHHELTVDARTEKVTVESPDHD
ncbi:PepSY domain-containing protein [Streptomyces sp. NPDC091376]|uniref:PepSY domain-containing protein n=1 Tax=Streptomyces sp. NPDC091376 TaxID=3365994 RepID=UPI00382C5C2C